MLELHLWVDRSAQFCLGTGFPVVELSDPLSPHPKCLSQPSSTHFTHLTFSYRKHRNAFFPRLVRVFRHLSFFPERNGSPPLRFGFQAASMECSSEPQPPLIMASYKEESAGGTRRSACIPNAHTPTLGPKPQLWTPVKSSPSYPTNLNSHLSGSPTTVPHFRSQYLPIWQLSHWKSRLESN